MLRISLFLISGLLYCLSDGLKAQFATPTEIQKGNQIESMMKKNKEKFEPVLSNPGRYRVQIIYTQINRDKQNKPHLKHYAYRLDTQAYFYPASMIKLPLAALALEKLNLIGQAGVNRNTRLEIEVDYPCQTGVTKDTTSPTGYPTVANYIRKLFAVSDNDAYNRLYEIVGKHHYNTRLWNLGYPSARFTGRFWGCDDEGNKHTNPIQFYTPEGKPLFRQEPGYFEQGLSNPYGRQVIGKGRYSDSGQYYSEGWDFTQSSFISLWDLHQILISMTMPSAVPAESRFILTEKDYEFLRFCMGASPREFKGPHYNPDEYYDAYVKYLMFGRSKDSVATDQVRIFNKVGMSFGFLTDCAYIIDYKNKTEFFLSAVIYANEDEVINDDNYDYNNIGLPFLRNLGYLFYEYELTRKRKFKPRFSKWNPDGGYLP